MRLIDADEMKRDMYCNVRKDVFGSSARIGKMMNYIDKRPTVDAVPVVRCRNCAHCDDKTPYELWCLGRGWPNQMVPPDGFCDRGKRRPDT